MAGGDSRIQNTGISGYGLNSQLEVLDAHSTRSGDFTQERQVGNEVLYLTPEGAEAFDALKCDGWDFTAERDPSRFMQWLLGGVGLREEKFQGKAEEP